MAAGKKKYKKMMKDQIYEECNLIFVSFVLVYLSVALQGGVSGARLFSSPLYEMFSPEKE